MKAWWDSRAPRERVIMIIAAFALSAMLYFLMVWEPIIKARDDQQRYLQDQVSLNNWLRQVEPEVRRIRSAGNTGTQKKGSVLSIADSTAKAGGLGGAIKRMQPEGEQMVRVWLEDAPFNTLVTWLHSLETTQGIQITDFNVSQDDSPGLVKARLTLKR